MKNTYQLLIAILWIVLAAGCTKYEKDFDLEANDARQNELNDKILKQLGDAPLGWIMYIPSMDTALITATPVIIKFDIAKGTFTTQSPFPASASSVPSLFELSSATGSPLLSFASGSVFSSFYESGNINDYYFKVLSAGVDTIAVQPYRKGNIYASEGGIPMKLVKLKAPITWFDSPVNLPALFIANDAPFYNSATNTLKLTYKNGYVPPAINMEFSGSSAGNMNFFRTYLPFCRDLGMYPVELYVNSDYNNGGLYYCGNNALYNHIDNGVSPVELFVNPPRKFMRALKTDYLLVRSVNADRTKIGLFAVDKDGNEIITGTLEVE